VPGPYPLGVAVRSTMNAILPLYTFGKIDAGNAAAVHGVKAQDALLERTRQQTAFDVTRAYWGYQTTHFGLASIVAAGGEQSVSREALTPAYAPPESFWAEEPTAAADVYSMAATLRSVKSAPFSNQAISSALLIRRAACITSMASSNVASGMAAARSFWCS